jgi:hypothetical protein
MHAVSTVLGIRPVCDVLSIQDWCYSYSNGVTPLPVDPETPIVAVPAPPQPVPGVTPVTVINEEIEEIKAIALTVINSTAIPMSNMLGSLLKRGFGSEKPKKLSTQKAKIKNFTSDSTYHSINVRQIF